MIWPGVWFWMLIMALASVGLVVLVCDVARRHGARIRRELMCTCRLPMDPVPIQQSQHDPSCEWRQWMDAVDAFARRERR